MRSGAPVLSTLLFALGISGPVIMAIRGELVQNDDSVFHDPKVCAIAPENFVIYAVVMLILFSIRHVEYVVGSFKIFIVVLLSYLVDAGVRTLCLSKLGTQIAGSGPYTILLCIYCIYCVMMPTVKSRFIGSNEKIALLCLFAVIVFVDGVTAGIPLLCGFIVFLITGGAVCFPAKEKTD